MTRAYTATVVVIDDYCEGEPDSLDMQDLLDMAFAYVDGVTARVAGDVTITEEDDA